MAGRRWPKRPILDARAIAPARAACYIPAIPAQIRSLASGLISLSSPWKQPSSRCILTRSFVPMLHKARYMAMKRKLPKTAALVVLLLSVLVWPGAALPPRGAQLTVDDDKVECPNAGFSHIQDAVDAASPGDEIHICKGIYVEQVTIRKALSINADNGGILMPSAMKANTTSLFDAAPIATALLVADTTGVSISGLTVDGVNNGIQVGSKCVILGPM